MYKGRERRKKWDGKLTPAFDPCTHACSYLRKVFFWETSLAMRNWAKVVVAMWVYLGW